LRRHPHPGRRWRPGLATHWVAAHSKSDHHADNASTASAAHSWKARDLRRSVHPHAEQWILCGLPGRIVVHGPLFPAGHPHGALLLDGMWRVLRRCSWSAGLPKLGLAVCDAFIAHGSEGVVRPLQVGIAGDPLPQAGTVYAPYCVEWVWFFCGESSTRPARFNVTRIRFGAR